MKSFGWRPAYGCAGDLLDLVHLKQYSDRLAESKEGLKALCSFMYIRAELRAPYADPRLPFQPPSEEYLFKAKNGVSYTELRRGMTELVTVTRVDDRKVGVRLQNGVYGMIPFSCLSQQQLETTTVGEETHTCVFSRLASCVSVFVSLCLCVSVSLCMSGSVCVCVSM